MMGRSRVSLLSLSFAALLLTGMAPPPPKAKDASKAFVKAFKRRNVQGMVEAAKKLAESPTKKGVTVLVKYGALYPSMEVYRECRTALGAAKEGAARSELLKMLKKSKRPEQRVLCVDGLGASDDPGAVPALSKALKDRAKEVRISAIRALNRIEHKTCIRPLYERLAKVGFKSADAEAEELYKVLFRLTGKQFETLQDWKKWWSFAEKDFDPKKRKGNTSQSTRVRKGAGKIFGSEIRSQSFVLVLDISSSMRVIDMPRGKFHTVKRGKNKGKKRTYKDPDPSGQMKPKKDSRFRKAQEAFSKFLQGLNANAKFAIVVFGEKKDCRLWKPKLVKATAANKKAVIKFIQGLKMSPATRTDMALDLAFKVQGADSIYLFSDGIPEKRKGGKGVDIPQDQILQQARALNRARKLTINCYAISSNPSTQAFLRNLAKEHGGEFKDIRAQ